MVDANTTDKELSGDEILKQAFSKARDLREEGDDAKDDFKGAETEEPATEEGTDDSEESAAYDKLSSTEKKAWEQGWRPREMYISQGGDPDKWSSAHEWIKYGDLQRELRRERERSEKRVSQLEEDYGQKFINLDKYYKSTLEEERDKLLKQQRDAVDDADVEQYDKATEGLKKLEDKGKLLSDTAPKKAPAKTSQEEGDVDPNDTSDPRHPYNDPVMVKFRDENPWIKDSNDKRSKMAMSIWKKINSDMPDIPLSQAVELMNDKLKEYKVSVSASTNPMRTAAATTETSRNSPRRSSGTTLTMNSLTESERTHWGKVKDNLWVDIDRKTKVKKYDEKGFLESVAIARKLNKE